MIQVNMATGRQAVEQILELMQQQRDNLFVELANITDAQLWFKSSPDEWSIGENIDHMRVLYASMLPMFRIAWAFHLPFAKLRRNRPYRTEIDNVYHRPGFPQKVGWMWPSKYTPARPAAFITLREGIEKIHDQVNEFYRSKEPDLLGQTPLWDPAIGILNLIQALRVGVYHDQIHCESIQALFSRFDATNNEKVFQSPKK